MNDHKIANDWISVEDKLPEVGQYVLAELGLLHPVVMLFTNTLTFKYTHHTHDGWSDSVTHWMSIPPLEV